MLKSYKQDYEYLQHEHGTLILEFEKVIQELNNANQHIIKLEKEIENLKNNQPE